MKRITLFFCILSVLVSTNIAAQTIETTINPSAQESATLSPVAEAEKPIIQQAQAQDRSVPFLLHGRVLDSGTGQPIAFANVGVKKLGIGTATNQDGEWTLRLPASAANALLHFSILGYKSRDINIAELGENSTIRLAESTRELAEVVVVAHDFIGDLLRKAYKSIPENYPTKPTMCNGFFRETQRVNDSLFLYIDEAVLNVYKNTYKNAKNFGQIRIEKSRKNVFPNIDSINDVRFYAGPHFPNDLDIVFSRWDFIKPSEYRNWAYELGDVYKDSLSEIYTINFKNRKTPNSSFQGKIFIDMNNYAYVGFELKRAGLSVFSQNLSPDITYIPGNVSIKIGYLEKDNKYNLSYITYKTNGVNTVSKTRIYKDIDYVTTAVKTDSVKPIPFSQQFDYTAILSIEADDYSQSFWKDYNVLQQSKTMTTQTNLLYQNEQAMTQLSKVYKKELTEQEKTLIFLKRFTFDGGFAYHPINYRGGLHQISYGAASANVPVSSKHFGISTMDGIRFELTKQFTIFSTLSAALYGIEQIQYDLGLSYRLPLAPSGRLFFLDLGLGASTANTKIDICSLTNTDENLHIGGKKFDSNKIDVKAGKSGYGIKPVVGLAVRMGKKYELFMDGAYFLPFLFKKEYVQFKEAKGPFFGKKSVKVDWNDQNMSYKVDNNLITSPRFDVEPYQFRLGIRSGF